MKRTLQITALAVLISSMAIAQQTRQTNMYTYNKYSINPAYAGYSGCTEVNFSHLNQWVKIDGAPVTNFLSANSRLGKSFGIGGNVLLDKIGMFQQFSISGSVAYGVTIAKEHNLRIGLSGGYFQMRLDPTDAIAFDSGDNILNGGVQSSNSVATDAGILYSFKGLELSFASKQLIETRSNFNYENLDGYGLKRHFIGYGAYNFILNKEFSLTPSVLYKGVKNNNQFDINVDVNYNDFIYGGLGFRTDVGIVGRVGISVYKLFFIGYAYEIPMLNIAAYSSGSHEIALGLKFCKRKKEIPVDKDLAVDPVIREVDTITIVETITDTLIVERVDTVYVNKPSNDEVRRALVKASDNLAFESDKAIILKESYGELESLTNLLLVREELKIELAGHTDDRGTAEYNMRLSKDRVDAVKDFFIANGIDSKRIKTAYFGETNPIADNKTEEGRAKNRRVEMKIIE